MSILASNELQYHTWKARALEYYAKGDAAMYYYCEMKLWYILYYIGVVLKNPETALALDDEWQLNDRPKGSVGEADPL